MESTTLLQDCRESHGKTCICFQYTYDSDNRAWIHNGTYQDLCDHLPIENSETCLCYGRIHKGERAPNIR